MERKEERGAGTHSVRVRPLAALSPQRYAESLALVGSAV